MSQPVIVEWGFRPMLKHLSTQLSNELRLAGFPALYNGGILWGAATGDSRKAPPAIVAHWVESGWGGAVHGTEISPAGSAPVRPVLTPIASDLLRLEFDVWAASQPPDPTGIGESDACRYLVHQLCRVIHRAAEPFYRVIRVSPQPKQATDLGKHAMVLVEFSVPVVDNLIKYVEPGTKGTTSVANGSGEVAATFSTPAVS